MSAAVRAASTAAVKTASTAKASASARRKTPFLSTMAEAAEGARSNAALAARRGITASGPAVAAERLGRSFATVVNTTVHSAPVESVAVIKGAAVGGIPRVVENRVVVMPIATPMVPAPSVVTKKPDAEAHSEEERRAFIPNARIGIPARPGDNWVTVHDPGIVRRNVDDFWADRLDLECRSLP